MKKTVYIFNHVVYPEIDPILDGPVVSIVAKDTRVFLQPSKAKSFMNFILCHGDIINYETVKNFESYEDMFGDVVCCTYQQDVCDTNGTLHKAKHVLSIAPFEADE